MITCILFLLLQAGSEPVLIPTPFTITSDTIKTAAVAGSFNNWNPSNLPLKQSGNTWSATINLQSGFYYYKLVINGNWISDPGNPWLINDGGSGNNSIIKVGNPGKPVRKKNRAHLEMDKIPEIVLDHRPDFVALYNAAWEMAWNHIEKGTESNGFSEFYMDEAFNELIYQWDTSFMTAFAVYGRPAFPAMESLDNFYAKQRKDGYIQRVYWESDGKMATEPTPDEPMVNPPLFAWMEYRYLLLSGDTSRVQKIYPVLTNYFRWLENNLRHPDGHGLYYQTELGSGMDNIPRPGVGKSGWIDQSAQMVLFARSMAALAEIAGLQSDIKMWHETVSRDSLLIQKYCWNETTGWFHDIRPDLSKSPVKHVGAMWTMLAGISTAGQNEKMIGMLNNPETFNRKHRVPALSADDPEYDPLGHYWRGGVWAPTNYATVAGLKSQGFDSVAREISLNHLNAMSSIFLNPGISDSGITWEDRFDDGYHTIWECYAPDSLQPATRWDKTFRSRQDFVGWSGLGPIAMLIENILGLNVNSYQSSISWNLDFPGRKGISRLPFRSGFISLLAEPEGENWKVSVETKESFTLILKSGNGTKTVTCQPGKSQYLIALQ